MIVAAAFLFLVAAAAGFAQYMHEVQNSRNKTAYTFIVDPPTMFLVGMLGTMAGLFTRKGRTLTQAQFRARKAWIDRALTLFFAAFWVNELLAYFNVMKHPYDAAKTGNDFMWNGYVDLLGWHPFHWSQATYHYWWSFPLLAGMAVVQWYCLRAGRVIGYMNGYFGNLNNWSTPKPGQAKADANAPKNDAPSPSADPAE